MKEQPRGDVAVGRVLFDQCARREHRGLAHLVGRHPVIDILQGFGNNQLGIHPRAQTLASRRDHLLESSRIERAPHAVLDGMKLRLWRRLLLRRFVGARLGALFPVQDIGARDFVLARTHQRELDLVLDVFYMEGPAPRLAAYQCADDGVGQRGYELPDPRRRGALPAFNGKKRLGHRDGNLAGLEADYRAVAADDLVLREGGVTSAAICIYRLLYSFYALPVGVRAAKPGPWGTSSPDHNM